MTPGLSEGTFQNLLGSGRELAELRLDTAVLNDARHSAEVCGLKNAEHLNGLPGRIR